MVYISVEETITCITDTLVRGVETQVQEDAETMSWNCHWPDGLRRRSGELGQQTGSLISARAQPVMTWTGSWAIHTRSTGAVTTCKSQGEAVIQYSFISFDWARVASRIVGKAANWYRLCGATVWSCHPYLALDFLSSDACIYSVQILGPAGDSQVDRISYYTCLSVDGKAYFSYHLSREMPR